MTVRRLDDGATLLDNGTVDAVYLPSRVIVYTTGNLAAWDALVEHNARVDILNDPIRRAIAELPGHLPRPATEDVADEVQTPLLLLRESRLAIIALTGLLASLRVAPSPLAEVLASLNLVGLRGFSLRLRLHQALSDYELFDQLRPHATRSVQQGSDHLLVFTIPDA